MADYEAIRKYTSELVKATFEGRKPSDIPEGILVSELIDIATKGQMPYLLLNSLLKVTGECEEAATIKNKLVFSTIKTFRQVFSAREITKAFEEKGIRYQILKGTLMKELYPSPEMREMSDIDLVVYDESLDRAAALMEELGYTNHGLEKHHMIFTKENILLVEVHWCLFDANAGKKQHLYFKDNFRAKLKEGTRYSYEFSNEDFYIYMISHMAKHFFETGCGIRNLVDIYVYINKFGDSLNWEYLNQELDILGIKDFEKNVRELAYIWLDNKESDPFFENLFEYMVESGIYGKRENGIWSQLAKETTDNKSGVKMHFYFPSIAFMKEKYPWLEKAPFLLPMAWVIRGITGVSSKQARDHRQNLESSDKKEVEKMLEIYHKLNLQFRR
jgi:hypothetical protein